MKISTQRLLLVLACFVAAVHYAASDCCGRHSLRFDHSEAVCNDCTNGDPCCGTGDCNVFCCGCDGGCRGDISTSQCPTRQQRDTFKMPYHHSHPQPHPHPHFFHLNESDVHSILGFADYDDDGKLNFGEADFYLTHLKKDSKYKGREDLIALDLNHDGFLTIDEIDPVGTDVPSIDGCESMEEVDPVEPEVQSGGVGLPIEQPEHHQVEEVDPIEPEIQSGGVGLPTEQLEHHQVGEVEQPEQHQVGEVHIGQTGDEHGEEVPIGQTEQEQFGEVPIEFVDIDTRSGRTENIKAPVKRSKF